MSTMNNDRKVEYIGSVALNGCRLAMNKANLFISALGRVVCEDERTERDWANDTRPFSPCPIVGEKQLLTKENALPVPERTDRRKVCERVCVKLNFGLYRQKANGLCLCNLL